MSTKEPQQDVNVGNVVPTKTAASGDEAAEEAVTPKVPQVDETLIRGRLALGPRPGVPKWIAWGVLVFAMLSSAIFLVGQITAMWGLGGAVSVELSNGQVLTMSSVPFEMSLFFSLKACIETGLVPEVILGVILFFFSGIWPHAKLLLMLYCWFGNMSHRFRQIVLYWIGSFGKFSFADPLIVAVLMVAFTLQVSIGPEDFLFDAASKLVIADLGADIGDATVESMTFALVIVSFRGIYFFCGGVWLSLSLGAIVDHYQKELIVNVLTEEGLRSEEQIAEGDDKPHPFRTKVFWLSGLLTLPILVLLIVTVVVPLFEKNINGVFPFLLYGFGWIPAADLAPILVEVDYGDILKYVTDVQGGGAKFMAATIVIFVIVFPFFRAPVLDLMWLPKSMTKKYTSKLYLMYNLAGLLDSLAVFLFAVILVHFEIDAIAMQIDLPFCGDVATVAGVVDDACPNVGPIDYFDSNPAAQQAADRFLSESALAQNVTEALQSRCSEFEEASNSFSLANCVTIELNFLSGMWIVTIAVTLVYFSSMLLAYPISIELYGKRFFEAPVAYLPGGWCCCACCTGKVPKLGESDDEYAVDESACIVGMKACSYSCKNACWCRKRKPKAT